MKRLLSLFDYSGGWSQVFADNGWDVIQWDIKLDEFLNIHNIDSVETALELFENVDGILAAPPCTDFTNAGAQYWNMKDESGQTAAAVALVNQVQKLADLFTPTDPDFEGSFFWVVENPVGRLPKLVPELGKPIYFDPWQFAGHLDPDEKVLARLDQIREKNGYNVTAEESNFVVEWNAYTKKTGLFGCFNKDLVKKPIKPVKCAPQGSFTQRLGGKSEKTKEARSNTPQGFAKAFFDANNNYEWSVERYEKEYENRWQ